MITRLFPVLLGVVLLGPSFWDQSARPVILGAGDLAPDFALAGTDGRVHSLSELRGRPVVLAWFTAAFTNHCTEEMKSLADIEPTLRAHGVSVVMISVDSPDVNKRFAAAHRISGVSILSDPDWTAAMSYGVARTFDPQSHSNIRPPRTTFYVDATTHVRGRDEEPDAKTSGEIVWRRLHELGLVPIGAASRPQGK